MQNDHIDIVSASIESAIAGEQALRFQDPLATGLLRSIQQLTPEDVFKIGQITLELLLARQLASACTERQLALMRDKSKPL